MRSSRLLSATILIAVFGVVGLVFALSGGRGHAQEIGPPLTVTPPARALASQPIPSNLPADQGNGPISVLIELSGEPTARTYARLHRQRSAALAAARAQAQLALIEQAQTTLLAALAPLDAHPIYRTQRVYNGIAVQVDARHIAAIRALPNVKAVHPLLPHTVATVRSVPLLSVPELWSSLSGFSGESISIGIIDTGIDYLHVDFGGPGTGYRANDPTVITDVLGGITFPTAKVVGGYDFAGDQYDAGIGGNPFPWPDPDPMDCYGHGTHVAGIAAGTGVTRLGESYPGPYGQELDFADFSIGPGVAPRADLYALKIFGCGGASSLTNEAIEWAVDPNRDGDFSDHLDVINMSLGSEFGAAYDPSAVASENAAAVGVIVVAAAGNDGDTYYIVSAPSVSQSTISVASSTLSGILRPLPTARLAQPLADSASSFSARGPRRGDSVLKPDIAAPGDYIFSAKAGSGNRGASFSGTSMATPHVAGAAALLRQIYPGWTVEEIKALLLNTARIDLHTGGTTFGAGRGGAGRLDLHKIDQVPLVAYDADDPGAVALSFGAPPILGQTTRLKTVRLANKSAISHTYFLTYSSVVDMPGVDVVLQEGPSVTLAPYATGSIDVLLRGDSGRMQNSLDPTVERRLRFPRQWLSEESGYLYFWPSLARFQTVLTVDQEGRSAAVPSVGGTADWVYTAGDQTLAYTLTVTNTLEMPITEANLRWGQTWETGPIVQPLLAAGAVLTAGVTVTGSIPLDGEAGRWLAAGALYVQLGSGEENGVEMRGQAEPVAAISRLPVYAAPRAISAMGAQSPTLAFGASPTSTQSLPLVGQGLLSAGTLSASDFPTDTVSIASALELQFSSPNERSSPASLDYADLKYVGVASDIDSTVTPAYPAGDLSAARLVFAIVTHGEWSTPNAVTFRIHIDIDQDGMVDYIVRNESLGEFQRIGPTDEFFSVVSDLDQGTERLAYFVNLVSSAELNTAVFNSNVLLLAVDVADLGLTPAHSAFTYFVTSHSLDSSFPDGVVDSSAFLAYDPLQPGLETARGGLGGLPLYYDLPGMAVPVVFDRAGFRANRSTGLLLIHYQNELGRRAEVVAIEQEWRYHLPLVLN